MKYIGIKQACAVFPELVRRAEAGQETLIVRQGRVVARLVGEPRRPRSLPTLRAFRRSLGTGGTSAVNLLRAERFSR